MDCFANFAKNTLHIRLFLKEVRSSDELVNCPEMFLHVLYQMTTVFAYPVKYGFWKKSFRKNEPLTP